MNSRNNLPDTPWCWGWCAWWTTFAVRAIQWSALSSSNRIQQIQRRYTQTMLEWLQSHNEKLLMISSIWVQNKYQHTHACTCARGKAFSKRCNTNCFELTDIDGPRISRKSILRNRSHRTSSSTDGYRLSGDSNIICSTSTTYVHGWESILCYCTFQFQHYAAANITFVRLDYWTTKANKWTHSYTLCSAYSHLRLRFVFNRNQIHIQKLNYLNKSLECTCYEWCLLCTYLWISFQV